MPPAAWEHADFAAPATLRRRVRAALRALDARGERPRISVRRVRCWGITAWVGDVALDADAGRAG